MYLTNIDSLCDMITTNAGQITEFVAKIIKLIQLVVPILLIIWGMLDLGKAVIAQKDDEIKKGQKTFIARLITAAILFLIVTIVKLLVSLISKDNQEIINCIDSIVGTEM